ncbi:AIPR family protein [Jiangella alkaliphila]|nr:AIPR family protein [Jiangella alkaliphila]
MVNNELVLLDQVLVQREAERTTPIAADYAFELFACEQALRERELSSEEISDGVIGGGNDGGFDGIYALLNEAVLTEDSEVLAADFVATKYPARSKLELWLVQAKREESFSETAIEKASDSARRLLNLSEAEEDLLRLYSRAVVERISLFRKALRALATRRPTVTVWFVYASRGTTSDINAKVEIKGRDLQRQLAGVITGAEAHVEFLGAVELWQRVNSVPSYTSELEFQENVTRGNGHVALVKLRDYVKFLKDEDGTLRRYIFDWNVRDYQGDVEVNREIGDSIKDVDSPEFWWLNNGITVVCSSASTVSKTYILDNVQVVNGLQTSYTIFNELSAVEETHAALDRAVLVRILVTGDDLATRDRVIRATNRQTSVPAASLRATDDIQRDIEAYFLGHGWFYDRRKNYYRNIGKSSEKIISIPLLAQAVMAMGLGRPDNSRARPSSLLKRDEDYKRVFSRSVPLPTYLWLAESQKKIDAFLLSDPSVTAQERTDLRFHVAMVAARRLVGQSVVAVGQLNSTAREKTISDADLHECLELVREAQVDFSKASGDSPDKIAKGPDFVLHLSSLKFDPLAADDGQ